MQRALLSVFATQIGVSEKTLKRKFGDCIYRIGRQSFIDVDTFNKVFVERTQKGRKHARKITESTSIKRIQMHIPKTQLKISRMHVEYANLETATKAEPEKQRKTILQNNARRVKINIKQEETLLEKLFARIDTLIERETQTLLAFEEAGFGASEKKQ
jgi:hypothetical protein